LPPTAPAAPRCSSTRALRLSRCSPRSEEHELELSYILLTHHHPDHIAHNALFTERFGAPLCGHPAERELFGHLDIELDHEAELRVGELHVRALHVPGHTLGQLSFVVDEERVFTGDTLFRGSIGGTRGKGHTSFPTSSTRSSSACFSSPTS
jgi:hydroxyacylglutathione hydrolase